MLEHATEDIAKDLEQHFAVLHRHILECRSCRSFFTTATRKTMCLKGGDMFADLMRDYSRIRFLAADTQEKRQAARFINSIRRHNKLPLPSELDNPPQLFDI